MADFELIESPNLLVDLVAAGSACCVWHTALSAYIVTAAHVVEGAPPGTPVLYRSADGTAQGMGAARSDLAWLPMQGGQLDGGLVEIGDEGPFRAGGEYPRGSRILSWEGTRPDMVVQICGKHGMETARCLRKWPAGEVFENRRHGRLIEFRVLGGLATDPGDSGAAIISLPEGMLVGMHIAAFREAGATHTLAVAAEDIRETFSALLPGFDLRP